MIFGARLGKYTDEQLTALKQDEKAFFDAVSGGKYGNDPNEGYKYRGRGYNQLTFKGNYDTIGTFIGVDLIANPDLLLDSKIAAKACVAYFIRRFIQAPKDVVNYNDFTDINTATLYVFRANAGWGKNISSPFHQKTLDSVRNWAQIFTYNN
jgi:predicted chitinase